MFVIFNIMIVALSWVLPYITRIRFPWNRSISDNINEYINNSYLFNLISWILCFMLRELTCYTDSSAATGWELREPTCCMAPTADTARSWESWPVELLRQLPPSGAERADLLHGSDSCHRQERLNLRDLTCCMAPTAATARSVWIWEILPVTWLRQLPPLGESGSERADLMHGSDSCHSQERLDLRELTCCMAPTAATVRSVKSHTRATRMARRARRRAPGCREASH